MPLATVINGGECFFVGGGKSPINKISSNFLELICAPSRT